MRYRGMIFAIRTGRFRHWVQWVLTGSSPSTDPDIDIQAKLAEIRRRGLRL